MNKTDNLFSDRPRSGINIKKTHRHLNSAKAVAMAGEGVGKRNSYRVGAILYSGKQIIAAKHNSYQMSAKLIKYSNFPCRHAESNAILAHGMDNCEGLDMICTRVLKDGSLTMAEPCEACAELIKDVGLRRVYFTNWEGSVERFYF